MGKYSGKVLTVYITPSGVRVAEGENKNGSPFIARYFVVHGVEEFFSEVPGEPGTYEVTNMSGLVDAIVNECRNQRTSCRRVMVCSNCFGIETSIRTEQTRGSMKELLTGDLFAAGKKKDKPVKQGLAPDQMSCKITWGSLVEDGAVGKKMTESVADKFVLKSLVQEFYKRDYEVLSIADNIGTLINFRSTEEATFDSQGKIIFDFDTSIHVLCMKKDLPVDISRYGPMTEDEIPERVENLLVSCLETVGRNPKIYLTGSLMANTYLYSNLIDRLETSGYVVYDLFERPQADPITGLDSRTGLAPLTAEYSVNIAMFMSAYLKDIVSILPSIEFSEVFKKNSKVIATLVLALSLGTLCVSGFLAVSRFLEMRAMAADPPRVSNMEMQIQSLQMNKNSLESTIATLTKADVTVLDLMSFIVTNQSSTVTVVSVDTLDMLPATVTVDSGVFAVNTTLGDATVSGTQGGATGSSREAIVIRGYARSGPAAVAYYDRLFNSGLAVDPILNGIEKYELPNGEEVYIFEIQIGGVA